MIDNDSGNGATRPIIATINSRCNKNEQKKLQAKKNSKECRKAAGSRKRTSVLMCWSGAMRRCKFSYTIFTKLYIKIIFWLLLLLRFVADFMWFMWSVLCGGQMLGSNSLSAPSTIKRQRGSSTSSTPFPSSPFRPPTAVYLII